MSDKAPALEVSPTYPVLVPGTSYKMGTLKHLLVKFNPTTCKLDVVCTSDGQIKWFGPVATIYNSLMQMAFADPSTASGVYYAISESTFLENRYNIMHVLTTAFSIPSATAPITRKFLPVSIDKTLSMAAYPPLYNVLESMQGICETNIEMQKKAAKFLTGLNPTLCLSCSQLCAVPKDVSSMSGLEGDIASTIQDETDQGKLLCMPCAALTICAIAKYKHRDSKDVVTKGTEAVIAALNTGHMKAAALALTELAAGLGSFSKIMNVGPKSSAKSTSTQSTPPWLN